MIPNARAGRGFKLELDPEQDLDVELELGSSQPSDSSFPPDYHERLSEAYVGFPKLTRFWITETKLIINFQNLVI